MGSDVRNSAGYAGDVSPIDAWDGLSKSPTAQVIDVRTRAEWNFVGLPELGALGKRVLLAEWQSFPSMSVNAMFTAETLEALSSAGADKSSPIYCLCRSGARSRAAAMALTAQGYENAFNISGGFEGDADADGHRGTVNGWKADGLPWRQG